MIKVLTILCAIAVSALSFADKVFSGSKVTKTEISGKTIAGNCGIGGVGGRGKGGNV